MMKTLTNSVAALALSALVLTPAITVGTFLTADAAYAAGKSDGKGKSRGSKRSSGGSTSTFGATQSSVANAKGMEMKAQAMAKKGLVVASLGGSSLAPKSSPVPPPRPNRGAFAAEWKSMNAIWANENAFEHASDNSRLARILGYRDALVAYNEIDAYVNYEGLTSGEIQTKIDEGFLADPDFADTPEYASLMAQLELAQDHEDDQATSNAVCEGEPLVCNDYTDGELALMEAEGVMSDTLDTAAAGAEPPEGDALTAFNELLLEKFPPEE